MEDVYNMVRRQVALYRAYDARQQQGQRAGRGKQGGLSYGPYLLISREQGAGGSAIGQRVGKCFGWQVFDREIIDAIAERAHVRRELIESLDEHDRATLLEAIHALFHPQPIEARGYLAYLREVLFALGHQGDVVIIGRAATYALPSRFGLRVRVVAPLEARARRVASDKNVSPEAARAEVEASDRERTRLVQRNYERNLADPLNYDLTINTVELSIEAASELVIAGLERKLGVKPKGK
jgi:cytidylate kinase